MSHIDVMYVHPASCSSCNIDVYLIWPFNNDFSTTAL